jgi:putative RNA 2'-phosphotransferase
MKSNLVEISKFLSLVLRHRPEAIGLTLDAQGWAEVDELLRKAARNLPALRVNRAALEEVVATSDKQRFALSEDGKRIRANQGHSVKVDLGLVPRVPPEVLFHGTATRFLDSIRAQGLVPGERQQVHLSADYETAVKVGRRHGKAVVLKVLAGRMQAAGHQFFVSENGVWLVEAVPAEFLGLEG